MQQRALLIAAFALAALAGQASATAFNCSTTPCPKNGPQLCCDCAKAVSDSSVTPPAPGNDGFGSTRDGLVNLCTKCKSDLCKQCLAAPAGKYGTSYLVKSEYPLNTQPYLAIADQALFNLPFAAEVTSGPTKTLCPFITTSDTLKCFDLGYGSESGDNYGFYEALCVAANSDLQRRCMWQYTESSKYEGLPTTRREILKYTIPLCLHLQSEAQYTCLKKQVTDLTGVKSIPTTTTSTVATACGLAPNVKVPSK